MVYLFVYIVEAECGDDRWWFEILDSIQGAEKGQHEIEMQAPIYSILGSCQPTSRVHHRRRSVFRDLVVHSNSRVSGNLNIWAPTKGSSATCLLADVYKDFMVISMFDSQGVVFFFFFFFVLQFPWNSCDGILCEFRPWMPQNWQNQKQTQKRLLLSY